MKRIISVLLFSVLTMISAVSLNAAIYVIKDGRVISPNTVIATATPGSQFTFQVLTTLNSTTIDDDQLLFGVDGATPTPPPGILSVAGMHTISVKVSPNIYGVQEIRLSEPGGQEIVYYVQIQQATAGYLLCPTQNVTLDPSGAVNVNGATTLVVTSGSVNLKEGTVLGSVNGVTITYTGADLTITPASGPTVVNVKVATVNATPGAVINVPLDKVAGITSQCTFKVTVKQPVTTGYFSCPNTPVSLDPNTSKVVTGAVDVIMSSGSVSLLEGMLLGSANGVTVTYTGAPLTATPANSPQKINVRVMANTTAPIGTVVNVVLDKVVGVTSLCTFNVTVGQPPTAGYISCPSTPLSLDPDCSTVVNSAVDIVVTSGSVSLLEGMLLGSNNGITIAYTGNPLTVTSANSPQKINVRVTATASAPQGTPINVSLDKIAGITSQCAFKVTAKTPQNEAYFVCSVTGVLLDPNTSKVIINASNLMVITGSVTLLEGMLLGSNNGITVTYSGTPLTVTASSNAQRISVRVTANATAPQNTIIKVPLDKVSGVTSQCTLDVIIKPQTPAYFECPTTNITLNPNTYTHTTAKIVVNSGSVTLRHAQLIGQKDGININYPGPDLTIMPSNSPQTITVSITAMPNAIPGNLVSVPLNLVPGVASQCTFNVFVNKPLAAAYFECPTTTVQLKPNTYIHTTTKIVVNSGSVTLRHAQLIGQRNGININYPGPDLTITPYNSPKTITVSITAMPYATVGTVINVPLDLVAGVASQCAFNTTVWQ